jgi:hypothetical protein
MDIIKTKNRISGIAVLKRVDSSVVAYLAKAVVFAGEKDMPEFTEGLAQMRRILTAIFWLSCLETV